MPSHAPKRKSPSSPQHPNTTTKKPRTAAAPQPSPAASTAAANPTSHYFTPHASLLVLLRPRYDVLALSVLSSTSIGKHVARALAHLTRFSAWDASLLPGVVFLSAKTASANKLVTIAEVVRRRIGESEQKWWQYNVLSEMVAEEEEDGGEEEVVEDTFLGKEEGGEGEYFEVMGGTTTIHERATELAVGRVRRTGYVGVLLSRIPVGEMVGEGVAVQTNEDGIEARRRRGGGGGR
ncbi:hypothetical protein B0T18DRAFT_438981 [Schizothecium vesticola]|uniref:DNA/RNA-binding protein Alba-like domain-containing protein n=1 Tax=Schizothecium vesticola TaxID=314040 RepID=A0AA40EP01_9PEZI|nr:hypothetical protein B0T18DRAFT_438981 [Schizothecium vesticola]